VLQYNKKVFIMPITRISFLTLLNNPDIALSLTAAGILFVYAEFCRPGKILPGVTGSCLVTLGVRGLTGHRLTGAGLGLVAAAVLLLLLEAYRNTRGLAAACGGVALLFGLLRIAEAPGIHLWTAVAASGTVTPVTAFLLSTAVRARRNKCPDMLEGA